MRTGGRPRSCTRLKRTQWMNLPGLRQYRPVNRRRLVWAPTALSPWRFPLTP